MTVRQIHQQIMGGATSAKSAGQHFQAKIALYGYFEKKMMIIRFCIEIRNFPALVSSYRRWGSTGKFLQCWENTGFVDVSLEPEPLSSLSVNSTE